MFITLNPELVYNEQLYYSIQREGRYGCIIRTTAETPEEITKAKLQKAQGHIDKILKKANQNNCISISPSFNISTDDLDTDVFPIEGYLDLLSKAYSKHLPIAIAPHDIWYIILSNIASVVRDNIDLCRSLFTKSDTKEKLYILTDDVTKISMDKLFKELTKVVPADIKMFFPELSTHSPQSKIACMAAFADAVSNYYDYMTFLCGIPSISVKGLVEDWHKLITSTTAIAASFKEVGVNLDSWLLDRVLPILQEILKTVNGNVDEDFWKNIFTQQNFGSGGQLTINGWFKTLTFKDTESRLDNQPNTISLVPYKNVETQRSFVGIHGCFFAVKDQDGFLTAKYGEIISEVK